MGFFEELGERIGIYWSSGRLELTEDGVRFVMKNVFLYLLALIIALKVYDVAAVGPEETKIGLSRVNVWFRNLWQYDGELGYSPFWYRFVQILGYASLAVCAFWSILFFWDMIQCGGLDGRGTDKNLAASFFLYVLAGLLCLLFKVLVVNCGPIVMQGNEKPAPSFPSFYTVLFILAWGSMMFHIADTFNWGSTISHIADLMGGPKRFVTILHAVCTVIMLTGIFAVLRSGINWFTDVLGAFLLSVTLLCFYTFFFDI